MSGEGFLARWSRRKAGIASAGDAKRDAATPSALPATSPSAADTAAAAAGVVHGEAARPVDPAMAAPAEPLPTLADVAALTRESDYSRFMAPGVDGAVRNAAMKKLFGDPHFNVMDGLDVYIDDYHKPDPLPLAMLRKLRQSELLGLFADEESDASARAPDSDKASPDNSSIAVSSPSTTPTSTIASTRAEDDPDLRLQPDDGDRRPGAGEGPRA